MYDGYVCGTVFVGVGLAKIPQVVLPSSYLLTRAQSDACNCGNFFGQTYADRAGSVRGHISHILHDRGHNHAKKSRLGGDLVP